MECLKGKNIIITSGPMRGYIDAVRYISNKSTGRLGAAIATETLKRGAFVTLIYGAGSVIPDTGSLDKNSTGRLTLFEIETIDDLLTTIHEKLKKNPFDAIVHAMAVLDYAPEKATDGKIPSDKDKLTINLSKTPKVIKLLRELWPHAFLVGFKLEVGLSRDALVEKAYASLTENGADLVVANNQDEIIEDKHPAYIINSHREIESACKTRQDISKALADIISRHLKR